MARYTAVQRDDVIYSNYQSHLVFTNLVTDESARLDDNGGYGVRIMGSTDVQLNGCEAYRAGKHNFGVINSTQFVGSKPSGTNTAIALTSARENFQFYANALLAPQRVFALSDEGLRLGTTIS